MIITNSINILDDFLRSLFHIRCCHVKVRVLAEPCLVHLLLHILPVDSGLGNSDVAAALEAADGASVLIELIAPPLDLPLLVLLDSVGTLF